MRFPRGPYRTAARAYMPGLLQLNLIGVPATFAGVLAGAAFGVSWTVRTLLGFALCWFALTLRMAVWRRRHPFRTPAEWRELDRRSAPWN